MDVLYFAASFHTAPCSYRCNGLLLFIKLICIGLIKYICVLWTLTMFFKTQSGLLSIITQTFKFYLYQHGLYGEKEQTNIFKKLLYKKWALLASERLPISEMFQTIPPQFWKRKKDIGRSVHRIIPKIKGKAGFLGEVGIEGLLHSWLRRTHSVRIYLFIYFVLYGIRPWHSRYLLFPSLSLFLFFFR